MAGRIPAGDDGAGKAGARDEFRLDAPERPAEPVARAGIRNELAAAGGRRAEAGLDQDAAPA
jgi:hypothetical protein